MNVNIVVRKSKFQASINYEQLGMHEIECAQVFIGMSILWGFTFYRIVDVNYSMLAKVTTIILQEKL